MATGGLSDFDKIQETRNFFIDKTRFIKEFMDDDSDVVCILRPRQFGKSTNLSMLKSFLSLGAQPDYFNAFKIFKETEFMDEYCGKYPVIYLELNECKGDDWDQMYREIWQAIRVMVRRHANDLEHLNLNVFALHESLVTPPENITFMESILEWLMRVLHEKHHQRVIVLIDDYDAPLIHASSRRFYNEAAKFFGSFYSAALKQDGDTTLEKACLMGVVEVKDADILSDLNNLSVFCTSDDQFSQFFGFLTGEILPYVHTDLPQVLQWYSGYIMGCTTNIINPCSFVNYLKCRELKDYWISTSFADTLLSVLSPHVRSILVPSLELLCDYQLTVPLLASQVNYSKNICELSSILHLLVHMGYLKYERNPHDVNEGFVSIPNRELQSHWEKQLIPLMKEYVKVAFDEGLQENMKKALCDFDVATLDDVMKKMLLNCSFYNTAGPKSKSNHDPAKAYFMFYFGSLFAVLHDNQNIYVSSNRDSDHGRYNVKIEFRDSSKVIIIELRTSLEKNQLNGDAESGLHEIREDVYDFDRGEFDCLLMSVSFWKNQMSKIYWERCRSELKLKRITKILRI